ncbi:MAG: SpoIIE family protein phosphatase [Planctomycetes bacterium]|nr:SpoIIE family protein phosphatase [Planctomycetota bacterium]
MAQLVILQGRGMGKAFVLPAMQPTSIGSTPDATVRLDSQGAPELFAVVSKHSGRFTIKNCGANVNININGEPVRNERPLNHADLISLGDTVLLFSEERIAREEKKEETVEIELAEEPPATTVGRQQYYENTEKLMASFQETRDPSKHLASLLKATQTLTHTVDINELLPKIAEILFEVTPAERCALFLRRAKDGALRVAVAKTRDGSATQQEVQASGTILKEVLEKKEGVLTRNAMEDDRFSAGLSIVEQSIHSAMCVPLLSKSSDVLGVIYADAKSRENIFGTDDLKVVTGVAMQAALAIEHVNLIEQIAEKKRLQHEVELAHGIQMNLVPKEAPSVPGLRAAGLMIPAKEVGGDYYDLVTSQDGTRLYVVVGDVSGKGVPAGLVMMMARSFFRTLIDHVPSTQQIATELNRLLHRDIQRGMFMSMLILAYDTTTGKLTWTGAGHEHLLVYRAQKDQVEMIPSGGTALGVRREIDGGYASNELALKPDDAVLLYTDGVTEAADPTGEFFGLEATAALLKKCGRSDADQIVKTALMELKSFMRTAEQSDDITLVALKRTT